MPRRYTPVKTRYSTGGLTQEQLAAVACPTTLEEALAVPESVLDSVRELSKRGILAPAISETEGKLQEFLDAQRWRGIDRDALPGMCMELTKACLDAIHEAGLALNVLRGTRINPQTKRRIGGSRHPIDAWEYVLMSRLRAALEGAGVKAGAWSKQDAEGPLFELFRLCTKLAGGEVTADLSRARRVAGGIKRRFFDDARPTGYAFATGPQPQSPMGVKLMHEPGASQPAQDDAHVEAERGHDRGQETA